MLQIVLVSQDDTSYLNRNIYALPMSSPDAVKYELVSPSPCRVIIVSLLLFEAMAKLMDLFYAS